MTDPALALATAASAHATLAATAVAGRNLRLGQVHTQAAAALLDRIPDDVIDADLATARLEVLDARVHAGTPRTASLATPIDADPGERRDLLEALLNAHDALRLTQEYASRALPNTPGWSHYDARLNIANIVGRYGIAVPHPERESTKADPTWTPEVAHAPGPDDAIIGTALATAHERRRQIDGEGYQPDHDLAHPAGTLITAAACYLSIVHEGGDGRLTVAIDPAVPAGWPWEPEAWKPSTDPVRNLVKAAALICAEGDRDAALARTADGPL